MKQSFSNFCNNNKKKDGDFNKSTQENIQEKYDELKDLNMDELTERLYSEVKKQKENGTFDFNGLKDSVERIKPFVPYSTYQNMKAMLERIK